MVKVVKKSKLRKKKYAFVGFLFLIVLVLGFIINDYQKFNSFEQSILFGSKDSYSQNQSLYFDDIKITISEVEHKNYDFQTYKGCEPLGLEAGALMRANNFVETAEWNFLSQRSQHCVEMASLYTEKKMLIVHYFIENLSNKPLDIKNYSIKIVGDEVVERSETEEKITSLLSKQSRYNSFVIHHMDVNSNGPFALIVSQDNLQKQIQLDLPKLKPFCNTEICNQEVYSR